MDKALFEQGLQVRREVLGGEYVDAQIGQTDKFTKTIQELMTEYCWGAAWTRPGLDRKQRSLLNLGILIALNRGTEFKTHVRGALTNGLTKDQIREIFMQVAIYAGVPAGVDAFRQAREVFAEQAKK